MKRKKMVQNGRELKKNMMEWDKIEWNGIH